MGQQRTNGISEEINSIYELKSDAWNLQDKVQRMHKKWISENIKDLRTLEWEIYKENRWEGEV